MSLAASLRPTLQTVICLAGSKQKVQICPRMSNGSEVGMQHHSHALSRHDPHEVSVSYRQPHGTGGAALPGAIQTKTDKHASSTSATAACSYGYLSSTTKEVPGVRAGTTCHQQTRVPNSANRVGNGTSDWSIFMHNAEDSSHQGTQSLGDMACDDDNDDDNLVTAID